MLYLIRQTVTKYGAAIVTPTAAAKGSASRHAAAKESSPSKSRVTLSPAAFSNVVAFYIKYSADYANVCGAVHESGV